MVNLDEWEYSSDCLIVQGSTIVFGPKGVDRVLLLWYTKGV